MYTILSILSPREFADDELKKEVTWKGSESDTAAVDTYTHCRGVNYGRKETAHSSSRDVR